MLSELPLHALPINPDTRGLLDGAEILLTPWRDVCVILALLRKHQSARFLEIGTHKGGTTRIIKRKFPHLRITTIDPGDKVPVEDRPEIQRGEYLRQEEIGSLLQEYSGVEVIKERFEEVLLPPNSFDFIFIDGNHEFEAVRDNTRRALTLLSRPGVVVWHDVNNLQSVNDALATFQELNIITVRHTWIAFCELI